MPHVKEQNKAPEEEPNRMETSHLPDAEFKTLVIRMLDEHRRRVYKISENFNKEIENLNMEVKKHEKEPVRNEEYNN